jgi:hypothetical protein
MTSSTNHDRPRYEPDAFPARHITHPAGDAGLQACTIIPNPEFINGLSLL